MQYLDDALSLISSVLKENTELTSTLLAEYRTAQAPHVDAIADRYHQAIKTTYHLTKARKAIKHVEALDDN